MEQIIKFLVHSEEFSGKHKESEVGFIPNDWMVKKVSEFTEVYSGGTPSTLRMDYWGGEIRWMKSGELNLKIVYDVENRITDKGLQSSATKLIPKNCILIGLAGQGKTRGTVAINKVELCTNQSIAAILPCDEVDYNFLYFNLDFRYNELRMLSTGDGGRGGLNLSIINNLFIQLPSTLMEQAAIAKALSDADKYIQSLENLIAKKRLVKQGAMQELLKPKEGWVVKKLGDECELITKGTTPTSIGKEFQDDGVNFIKIESLKENGKIIHEKVAFIDAQTNLILKRSQLKTGDILFSIAGALGRIAIVKKEILPANTNQALAIIRLRNDSEIELNYLFYFLNNEKIQSHILKISVQGAQANLSLLNIYYLPIEYPSKSEQTWIAIILGDIEKEIESIEKLLEKARHIKQGMMQQLLTGKIRLV